jgi:hypothetical protein
MLTDQQRNALFVEVHREIEAAAVKASDAIAGLRPVDIVYPPNGGLTPSEHAALAAGLRGPELQAALRKIIADAAATPLFTFLTLLDGVADPVSFPGPWLPFHIAEATDDEHEHLMLHDVLFDSYWLWRDRRPDPGWCLDTYAGPSEEEVVPPRGGDAG